MEPEDYEGELEAEIIEVHSLPVEALRAAAIVCSELGTEPDLVLHHAGLYLLWLREMTDQ